MLIAALSGMRIEEIARLEARDISDGAIKVRVSKTPAGRRTVPIHTGLAEVFERRCLDKTGNSSLFPELPMPKPGSAVERSQPVSKQFTRYRRNLKVDEVPEGKRQSVIDFHSFRRSFAKLTKDALERGDRGYNYWTIAEAMGHETEVMPLGMTMRYSGESLAEAKIACVQAASVAFTPMAATQVRA